MQYSKIKSIETVQDYNSSVYDLSVADTHRYFVSFDNENFTLVSNSSMYPSTQIAWNISIDTYVMQIFADRDLFFKFIFKELDSNDSRLQQEVKVIVQPAVYYGEKDENGKPILGIPQKIKLQEVFDYIKEENFILTPVGAVFKHHTQQVGFISKILITFRELRDEFRAQLKEEKQKEIKDKALIDLLDRLQLAVKLLMNSGYGAIGTDSFVFFDTFIAESITSLGQLTIKTVVANLDEIILNLEAILEQEVRL